MKAEIKNRIEQIRQGKVPAGYKKSAIGIFPEDWEIVSLSRFFSFKNGINAEKGSFGRGTKLISVKDILSEQAITYDSIQGMISLDEKQKEAFKVHYGDILFQRSSENYEDVGKSNVYLDKKRDAVFSGFVIRGQKIVDYDPVYLNEVLRLPYVRKQIQRLGAGAQHINIGQDSLKNVHIAVAGKKEQEKLTSICLQQMKVIRFKENLLAEKLRQKQYLMQVLLTGKKRLPGFTDRWNIKKIGDICIINPLKEKQYPKRISFLEMAAVDENGNIINEQFKDYTSVKTGYTPFKRGDILIAKITPCFENGKGALTTNLSLEYGFGSTEFHVLRCKDVDNTFLYYHTVSASFRKRLAGEMVGSAGQKRIQENSIRNYPIAIPSLKEQRAIDNVLATADREINLLRQILEQERRKKKALMQLLLSGIVRVKP